MKKIVFFDIDGTLIDVPRGLAEPSDLTKYAIKELMNNGNIVFIASGRFKGNIPQSIKDLNPNGYILTNGAYIEYQNKPIYQNVFDSEKFDRIVKYSTNNNCIFTGETQEYIYTPLIDDRFRDYLKKWKIEYVDVSDKKDGVSFYKCCLSFTNLETAMDFEKEFKGIVDYRAQTADPSGLSYDINMLGVNKGSAVDIVINTLGIEKEDTYCFCDGSNDIELVNACKNSYVVKNGDDNLKKIAYGIADDVINDGVYYKLVELGLIEKKQ